MKWTSVAKTHQGLVREKNQDAFLDRPDVGVFIVADGMGGEQAGEEASAQVIATATRIVDSFFKRQPSGPSVVEGMMRDMLLEANQDVFQISVREPAKRGLGSTTSALCLHRGVYFIAQVGDSRIYLARGSQVQQVTRDHTLVWALYEQGAITRDQLETHPERHLLTQCIGSPRAVKVDTLEGRVQVGDTFLICSDGLTGYADEPRIFGFLTDESLSLGERADRMIDAALKAGGGDNVTASLIRVDALEESDDWKPEATAPPHRLEVTPIEPVAADDPATNGYRSPQKTSHGGRNALVAIVLFVILAAVGFVMLGKRPVKVYLRANEAREAPTLSEITVMAAKEGGQSAALTTQKDATGTYFEVPGPGAYLLTLDRKGYVTKSVKQDVERGSAPAETHIAAWVQYAHLDLQLPAMPAITALKLMGEATGDMPKSEKHIGGDELAKNPHLNLIPGVRYTLIVEAAGANPFTQRYQLTPGETRTVKVFFDVVGGGGA